jgi:aromatic ring-opening dioxygenase catalytic subunit (LigB family)
VRVLCDSSVSDHDWIVHRRKEGILILSGGLTVHNLRNLQSFVRETADPPVVQFNDTVNSAVSVADVSFLRNC